MSAAMLAGWCVPQVAEALSCGGPPWDTGDGESGDGYFQYHEPQRTLPVDGVVWQREPCPYEGEVRTPTCALQQILEDDTEVPAGSVAVELMGEDGCTDRDYSDSYVRVFAPEAPLEPGAKYQVVCGESAVAFVFAVRADDEPSVAPPELEVSRVHYTRSDDGCCSYGDYVELEFESFDDTFLREGGYLEVAYEDGRVFAMTRPGEGPAYILQETRGPITVTPVAADGARGDGVSTGEIDGDLVYLPCKSTAAPTPFAAWLLAPFVWICAHGRRRRSA